jgi:hypothetical protein
MRSGGGSGFFSNINRQGALEGQAAVINTIQALASGMSPAHVATMMAPQFGGAAVQGGLVSLKQVLDFMVSPIGAAVVGLTTLAVAMGKFASELYQVEAALVRANQAAIIQGRSTVGVENSTKVLAAEMERRGPLGSVTSIEAAADVQRIPNITDQTRSTIGQFFSAFAETQTGGDNTKAGEAIAGIFDSIGSMESFNKVNNFLTGQNKIDFDIAIRGEDRLTAAELLAGGLRDRFKEVSDAQEAARSKMSGWSFGNWGDIVSSIAYRAELRKQTNQGMFEGLQFNTGTQAPDPVQQRGGQAASKLLEFEERVGALTRQRESVQKALETAPDDTSRERFSRALEESDRVIRRTRTPQEEEESTLRQANSQVRMQLAEQAAQNDISQASRVAEVAKATLDEIVAHEQSALANRLGITSKLTAERVKAEQDYQNAVLQTQRLQLEEGLSRRTLTAADRPADLALQRQVAESKLGDIVRNPASTSQQRDAQLLDVIQRRQAEALEVQNVATIQGRANEALLQAQGRLDEVVRLREDENRVIQEGVAAGTRTKTEGAQSEAALIQARLNLRQNELRIQLAQLSLEQARNPQDTRSQIEITQRRLATISGDAPADEVARIELQKELVSQQRTLALEIENSAISQLKHNQTIAEARGDLEEVLRLQREINNTIQNSPKRSDTEKADSQRALELSEFNISRREVTRENIQSSVDRAQDPTNIAFQRQKAEEELRRLIQSNKFDIEAIVPKLLETISLRRQEALEAENVTIAQLKQNAAIAEGKGHLAEAVRLRQEAASIVAESPLRSPTERIGARTEGIQEQIRAQQQLIQLEQRSADLANRGAQNRLRTQTSYLNLQVERGDISPLQAIQSERQLTSQVVEQQADRLRAIASNADAGIDARVDANGKLADLYEQDAQNMIEAQIAATRAIQQENEKRTENIKNFFKTVEDGMAEAFAGALSGEKTFAEGLKDLRKNAISSFTKELFNMGSKAIGSSLASSLGVKLKEGDDTSISSVLAKAVGGMLGLTKDVPETNQAAISERMQQAGQAQMQAGNLMLQAAREMKQVASQSPARSGPLPSSTEAAEKQKTDIRTLTERTTVQPYETDEAVGEITVPATNPVASSKASTTSGDAGQRVTQTLRSRGWSDPAIQGALNNAIAESSLNPNAVGAAKEKGLFQFHPRSHIEPFTRAYGGDWSPEAQTNYMADVVERSMPGYSKSTDARSATSRFLREFERPKDQSDSVLNKRFGNDAESQEIIRRTSGQSVTQPQVSTVRPNLPPEPTRPVFPLGSVKYNSRGEPYSPSLDTMSAEEKANVEASTRAIREGQKSGKTWYREPEAESGDFGGGGETVVQNQLSSTSTGRTVADLLTEAAPRYGEITGGKDLLTDFRTSWGKPFGEMSTALRIKGAYDDPQIKPLMNQAGEAIEAKHPGFDFKSAFMAGKPSLDELLSIPVREVEKPKASVESQQNTVAQTQQAVEQGVRSAAPAIQSSTQTGVQQGTQQLTQQQQQVQSTSSQNVSNVTQNTSETQQNTQQLQQLNQNISQLSQQQKGQQPTTSGAETTSETTSTSTATTTSSTEQKGPSDGILSPRGDPNWDWASGPQVLSYPGPGERQEWSWGTKAYAKASTNAILRGEPFQTEESGPRQRTNSAQQADTSISQLQTSASQASSALTTVGQSASTVGPSLDVAGQSAMLTGTDMKTTGSSATQAGSQFEQAGQSAATAGEQMSQAGTSSVSGGGGSIGGDGGTGSSTSSGGSMFSGLGDIASAATAISSLTGSKMPAWISKLTAGISLLSSIGKMFSGGGMLGGLFGGGSGGLFGGGGGGGGGLFGGLGSIFSLLTAPFTGGFSLFGGLLGFEKGGVISSSMGGDVVPFQIPSAAGGMHVQETSLSGTIQNGIRQLAQTGNVVPFQSGRVIPSAAGGLGVSDGKGGRLAIVHPGELVVPASETRMILHAINDNTVASQVPSAAGGMLVGGSSGTSSRDISSRISVPSRISHGFNAVDGGRGFEDRSSSLRSSNLVESRETSSSPIYNDSTNIHIHAISPRDGADFIMRNSDAIAKSLGTARRNFNGRGR